MMHKKADASSSIDWRLTLDIIPSDLQDIAGLAVSVKALLKDKVYKE